MTVYYDRRSILVTERMMRVDDDVYAISAIEDVRVASRRSRALSAVALMAFAPVVLALMGLAASSGAMTMLLVAVVSLAAAGVAALALAQFRPFVSELWIQYDGEFVKVLGTDEDWRVQQLARALRKAIDASRGMLFA